MILTIESDILVFHLSQLLFTENFHSFLTAIGKIWNYPPCLKIATLGPDQNFYLHHMFPLPTAIEKGANLTSKILFLSEFRIESSEELLYMEKLIQAFLTEDKSVRLEYANFL